MTTDQEAAVLGLLTHGGKVPDIAKMLSEFTGRTFQRQDVYNVIAKLQKQFLVIDSETGEEKVEFQGVQVPVSGLALSQPKLSSKFRKKINILLRPKSQPISNINGQSSFRILLSSYLPNLESYHLSRSTRG